MRSPLKWHGGKTYLAPKLVPLFPRHLHYVEPYAGGLSVLLAYEGERSEVVNDLDSDLTNFWRVLQDDADHLRLQYMLDSTPLSRLEWESANEAVAHKMYTDRILRAWAFFVQCRQSLAGRRQGFTALTRSRLRRGINGNASEWLGAVEGLADVHARLRPVVIENKPALDLIRSEDTPNTFFYLDPPYMHATRATTGEYAFEMAEADHAALLDSLSRLEGDFMLSGYRSELYDHYAARCDWTRVDFDLPNNAASGDSKRRMTECIWRNYA